MDEEIKPENMRIHSRADELIACLEGEIAKRDEELAACRVAVENCEVFRARIAEMQERFDSSAHRTSLIGRLEIENAQLSAELAAIKAQAPVSFQYQARTGEWNDFVSARHYADTLADGTWPIRALYAAPVSEANAQGVVMPDTEDFCFCGKHVSLQMISGGASNHGYLGSVTLLIDGEYVEYTRLNAAPVQQVSVADDGELSDLSSSACQMALAHGIGEESFMVLARTVRDRCTMLAAPAAPAADAGVNDHE